MKYRTHITNPTGIKKIEKENFDISVDFPRITLNRLDINDLDLPGHSCISLIAQAGYTEQCIQLGTVKKAKIPCVENLFDIDTAKPLGFRIIIYDPETSRIQASCERIRARLDSEEADKEPLLPVEPVPLGEKLWVLYAEGSEAPVLHVNNDPKLDMLGFFQPQGDPMCRALVIPEALRQALEHVYRNEDLEWSKPWHKWIESLGQPPTNDVDGDTEEINKWANKCIDAYLQQQSLKNHVIHSRENYND
jgi:hypothetical protein